MSAHVEPEPPFQRLHHGEPVFFTSDACLIVRRPGMSCRLCREICPTGVLSGGQWSIALDAEGCLGCGLCAAACPTGALMVEGCVPLAPDTPSARIVLECRRVGAADLSSDSAVVTCLGGLTTPDLLDFITRTDAAIVIADHGWCERCPVGGCEAPWSAAVEETKHLLGRVDPELANAVVIERRDVPLDRAEPVRSALRPDKQVARREFLRRFVGAVEPRDALAESRKVVFGRGLVEPVKRRRILDRIAALSAALERDLPPLPLPGIAIAEGCELNGLCAAICPTGALRKHEQDGVATLRFDATNCIACGECQRVCPSRALSLSPDGDGAIRREPVTLVERRTVTCVDCGNSFVAAGDEQSCRFCRKTMAVMREAAALKLETRTPA